MPPDEGNAAYEAMSEFNSELQRSGAAVELQAVDRQPEAAHGMLIASDSLPERAVPVLTVDGRNANLFPGSGATFSVDIPAPDETRVVVKNVIGILRGSDPVLSKTAVLVTAHYDHIGTAETADGSAMTKATAQDRIYNGANDDGSGTVSVIEIAKAVTKLRPAPKRSLVFMTFFGEERGLLGSDYYGRHPVFPIAKTVADINLEQLGRTDELIDGKLVPQINSLSLTGFRYSTLTTFFEAAGRMLGVRVYEDKQASNRYFLQSDNAALARQGVPAHSLTVAFEFPDYHGVGDEWQKIDFSNMARIDKLIALAALRIADSRVPPSWNAQEAATQSYRDAQRRSQGESKF
ncbi:MAG: M28 family peptidase [Acidobacteriaceae bacterium]|nr:M28 family peptidase [Acidobacteriaceae bacterium]